MTPTTSPSTATSFMIGTQLTSFMGKKARLEAGRTLGQAGQTFRFIFEDTLSLGDLIEDLPGAGDVDLAQMTLNNSLLEITKESQRTAFRFSGDIEIGGLTATVELAFAKGSTAERGGKSKGSGYNYLMQLLFKNTIDLGQVLGVPGVEGVLFTRHSLYGLLGFIVTNDSSAGQRYQNLIPGFNFYGGFAITPNNEIFHFIGQLLGIQSIDLYLGVSEDAFQMQASIGLSKQLTESVTLSQIALAISSVYKPPQTEVLLKTMLEVKAQQEVLRLTGALGFETGPAGLGVFGAFTMQGKWHNPFGFNGLTIADVAAQAGFMPELPWLKELGLTGKMEIGTATLQLTIFVDLKNPQQSGFIARGENIRIGDIINTLTGPAVTIPGEIVGVMNEIYLRQLQLQVVPQPFAIGELRFDETGITVLADVQLWSWKAYMKVRADYDEGITAYANMSSFSVAGGLLEMKKSRHADPKPVPGFPLYDGPQLFIQVTPTSMPQVYITGSATLLGATADACINLSAGGLETKLDLELFGLFQASVELTIKTDLSLISLKAQLESSFLRKLTETVRGFIDEAVRKVQARLDMAIGRIQEAQDALDAAAAKWHEMIKVLKDAVDTAQREVNKLERTIRRLEEQIDDLEEEIDDLSILESWKLAYLVPELAGLYAAFGAVKAGRGALNLALEAARDALEAFEQANPLEIVLLPFKGALYAAEGVLEGTKAAVGGIADLAEKALEFAGEFFDVRGAMFEGQYSRLPERASFVTIKASLIFVGKPMDVEFGLDLKAIESGAKALMETLMEPLGDINFVPDMVDIPVLGSLF